VPATGVIVLLLLLAWASFRATQRGAGGRLKTAALALVCGTVALGCLVGAAVLVPCAFEQLFPDPAWRLPGHAPSFCPAVLSTGDR
jgi:hypothetical protein